MKSLTIIFGLLLVVFATCKFDNAFIKGAVKTEFVETIIKDEILHIVDTVVPCLNIETISEKVDKTLFKLDLELNNLRMTKFNIPESLFKIDFYHNDDPTQISKERCEADNSQGCEEQNKIYYPKCKANYYGKEDQCVVECPSGFHDLGLTCSKPAPYGRGAGYPWKFGDPFNLNNAKKRCEKDHPQGCEKWGEIYYPKCKAGFHNVACCICSPDCPHDFKDIGEFCEKPHGYSRTGYSDKYNNVASIKILKFAAQFDGEISVTVDGVKVMKHDTMDASISDTDLDIVLSLGMQENNKIAINFDSINLILNNFHTEIKGDLTAKVINEILKICGGLIEKELEKFINHMGSIIAPKINEVLAKVPSQFAIGKTMEIDYKLLEIPETNPDFIKYFLNGTINFLDSVNPSTKQNQIIPQVENTLDFKESLTLEIRDIGIDTILKYAFDKGKLTYAKELDLEIAFLIVKYVKIAAINQAPKINIIPGSIKTEVDLEMDLVLQVQNYTDLNRFKLNTKFDLNLNASIKDNKLKIGIEEFQLLNLTAAVGEQIPTIIIEQLMHVINYVLQKELTFINELIPAIQIPTQFDGVLFSQDQLTFIENYIVAQTDISFDNVKFQTLIKDIIFRELESPELQAKIKIQNICKAKTMSELFDA